jgi:23S rRNA (uridine2552-2'-O)-methyltransferase
MMTQPLANRIALIDTAASASGGRATDHLRIIALAETAAYFAFDALTEGGTFAAKSCKALPRANC